MSVTQATLPCNECHWPMELDQIGSEFYWVCTREGCFNMTPHTDTKDLCKKCSNNAPATLLCADGLCDRHCEAHHGYWSAHLNPMKYAGYRRELLMSEDPVTTSERSEVPTEPTELTEITTVVNGGA